MFPWKHFWICCSSVIYLHTGINTISQKCSNQKIFTFKFNYSHICSNLLSRLYELYSYPVHARMLYSYPVHTHTCCIAVPYTHTHAVQLPRTHTHMLYSYPVHTHAVQLSRTHAVYSYNNSPSTEHKCVHASITITVN